MPKNYCIMQIWAESGKSALPICNYSQILYQFLTFTQNLKRSPLFPDIHVRQDRHGYFSCVASGSTAIGSDVGSKKVCIICSFK